MSLFPKIRTSARRLSYRLLPLLASGRFRLQPSQATIGDAKCCYAYPIRAVPRSTRLVSRPLPSCGNIFPLVAHSRPARAGASQKPR
jgi:hypothetical protein